MSTAHSGLPEMLLKERHQNDAILNNNRNKGFKKTNSEKNANSKKKNDTNPINFKVEQRRLKHIKSVVHLLTPSYHSICCCCSITTLCLFVSLCAAHGLQHVRFTCPSRSEICLNSCPLSQWYYLTISSSVTPFPFCLQSFPVSQVLVFESSPRSSSGLSIHIQKK